VDLGELVSGFAANEGDPNVIVGLATGDDAGVYRIADGLALVQTVDYITPMVDDPYLFGQVAAANALSDVYAMGGRPVTALNVCCFPVRGVERSSLRRILEGGLSKVREAGAALVGGHTVRDEELKYGLSVTGVVDPARVVTNAGARAGDCLVLTKPVGTGAIATAIRRGIASADLVARAVGWMTMLNRAACDAMIVHGAHACTDITGFGLAGHALGMARAGGVLLRIRIDAVPRYPESLEYLAQGISTAMAPINLEAVGDRTVYRGAWLDEERWLTVDPQTSGGLLIALPAASGDALVERLRATGATEAAIIGDSLPPGPSGPGLEFLK
jgi:selenide,water dikinase